MLIPGWRTWCCADCPRLGSVRVRQRTGCVQVLRDPRLAKAIYAMHQRPGVN